MYVSVKYFKREITAFAGASYVYETHIPISVGDKVSAPVKNRGTGVIENKKAIVVDIDLPKPAFPCNVITELYEDNE